MTWNLGTNSTRVDMTNYDSERPGWVHLMLGRFVSGAKLIGSGKSALPPPGGMVLFLKGDGRIRGAHWIESKFPMGPDALAIIAIGRTAIQFERF